MTEEEVKDRLIEIFVEEGFKKSLLKINEEEKELEFRYKNALYSASWLEWEGDGNCLFRVVHIEDCPFPEELLMRFDMYEDPEEFPSFLLDIREGYFDRIRKTYLDLKKLSDNFCGGVHIGFSDILRAGFDVL